MPTLMPAANHAALEAIRARLATSYGSGSAGNAGVGGVFVPWTGSTPLDRGVYFIGIGLHEDITPEGETYEESPHKIDQDCLTIAADRRHTPFWAFLGELTSRLYGAAPLDIRERWGWSNLIKIGWSQGSPSTWPKQVIAEQAEACGDALIAELAGVRNSLVYIGSYHPYGVIERAFGNQDDWNKDKTSPWLWWTMEQTGNNLLVHGNHPKSYRLSGMWEPALDRIVELCVEHRIPVV